MPKKNQTKRYHLEENTKEDFLCSQTSKKELKNWQKITIFVSFVLITIGAIILLVLILTK